jgi:SAM-dependent methyltransferase
MGFDITTLHSVLMASKLVKNKDKALTLGRQNIHVAPGYYEFICFTYGIKTEWSEYCERLISDVGFKEVDSMDYSYFEGASVIHNLNKITSDVLNDKYDFIVDGGTIEHVFNIPQVLENIIKMLKVDGIFCSVGCNNNFSGHGFYQFSPELFLSCFTNKYGMKVEQIFIAESGSFPDRWINVGFQSQNEKRLLHKILTEKEVYIITFARKTRDDNVSSLIHDPPNQFSYEQVDWL